MCLSNKSSPTRCGNQQTASFGYVLVAIGRPTSQNEDQFRVKKLHLDYIRTLQYTQGAQDSWLPWVVQKIAQKRTNTGHFCLDRVVSACSINNQDKSGPVKATESKPRSGTKTRKAAIGSGEGFTMTTSSKRTICSNVRGNEKLPNAGNYRNTILRLISTSEERSNCNELTAVVGANMGSALRRSSVKAAAFSPARYRCLVLDT
ncbi:hypothetical protein DFS33DRAFT_1272335 [Desarmillaria ectypa]|nr:hypothetical protein DFS33DRAFT_1272335 [Desarmillaria ectypa]